MAKYTPYTSPPTGWTLSDPTTAAQLDETLKEIWDAANIYSFAVLEAAAGVSYTDARTATSTPTLVGTPSDVNQAAATRVDLGTATTVGTGFTATDSNNSITVTNAGTYRVTAHLLMWASIVRSNVYLSVVVNGTKENGIGASAYIRSGSGHNSASATATTVLTLSASDVITMESQQEGAGGTAYAVVGDTRLLVERLA